MIAYLKHLLKNNALTHTLGKRIRNYFVPHRRLGELAAAWSEHFFYGDKPELCYDLFKKCVDYQKTLAARKIKASNPPKRYLGFEWLNDIGTLAHLDIYAKIGLLGWRPPQESILVVKPGQVGNPFLLSLWKPFFSVLDDPVLQKKRAPEIPLLSEYYLFMEINKKILFSMTAAALVQQEWERQKRAPLLRLEPSVIENGFRVLAEIGMPRDARFVAVHVRQSGFHNCKHSPIDEGVRNGRIETYLPAIRKIVDKGGWVVRLGNPAMTPLPKMDRVFDYALSDRRRDWLDIFLVSQCRFLIGSQSGISHVGDVFGVPTLYANWASWGYWPQAGANVIIPKILWSRQQQRPLTFHEIHEAGLAWCQKPDVFSGRQIDVLDNTPEELEAGAEQMLRATETSTWKPQGGQDHIKKLCSERDIILNGSMSEAFLAKHERLFGPA